MTPRQAASEFRLYLINNWLAGIPSHAVRLLAYRRIMGFRIGHGSTIHMGCRFDCAGGLDIGCSTTINQRCRLDSRGGIRIGNSVSISANVTILTADHDLHSADFRGRVAPVIIEDFCFVGTGATILKNVHMQRGAAIGAGSVLTRDVPSGEIWAGNPARKVGEREIERYAYDVRYRRLFQ